MPRDKAGQKGGDVLQVDMVAALLQGPVGTALANSWAGLGHTKHCGVL